MPVIVSKATQHWCCLAVLRRRRLLAEASALPDGRLIVPHGMRETLILRHMGFKVPNPMELYYDYPHPTRRRTVQSPAHYLQPSL